MPKIFLEQPHTCIKLGIKANSILMKKYASDTNRHLAVFPNLRHCKLSLSNLGTRTKL